MLKFGVFQCNQQFTVQGILSFGYSANSALLQKLQKKRVPKKKPWDSSFSCTTDLFCTNHPKVISWIEHAPRLFCHNKEMTKASILIEGCPIPPKSWTLAVASFHGKPCQETNSSRLSTLVGNVWRNSEMEALINSSKNLSPLFLGGVPGFTLCIFWVKCKAQKFLFMKYHLLSNNVPLSLY